MSDINDKKKLSNDTKGALRLVKLYELLKKETNEDHPLSTPDILLKLKESGCPCVRQTLKSDIECLQKGGYQIIEKNVGHANGYYIPQPYSAAELKLLIDAVNASGFVTEDKASALKDKIIQNNGAYTKDLLEASLVNFRFKKHTNESIYLNIETSSKAIATKHQLKFYYFLLNENHEKKYKHNKKRYTAHPLATIYNEDYYYLVCYDKEKNDIVNYRMDRMDMVEISKSIICTEAEQAAKRINAYTDEIFKMFGGPVETVTLQFEEELMKVIYDKFGEDTEITRIVKASNKTTNLCKATVQVQVSPTFWGWLFQFGNQMRIVSPQKMIVAYKAKLLDALN